MRKIRPPDLASATFELTGLFFYDGHFALPRRCFRLRLRRRAAHRQLVAGFVGIAAESPIRLLLRSAVRRSVCQSRSSPAQGIFHTRDPDGRIVVSDFERFRLPGISQGGADMRTTPLFPLL